MKIFSIFFTRNKIQMPSTEPVLFYKQTHKFGCFSNFYKANIIINSQQFNCNEQYIMYSKAVLFKDDEYAAKILNETNPMNIKSYGRKIRGFDENIWIKNREIIADQCNLAKFTQHKKIRDILLSTDDAIIAEASPTDAIWGIGVNEDIGKDINKWKGLNILGQSLMRVRDQIRSTCKNNQ